MPRGLFDVLEPGLNYLGEGEWLLVNEDGSVTLLLPVDIPSEMQRAAAEVDREMAS